MKVTALAQAREPALAGYVIPETRVHLLTTVLNLHLVERMPHVEAKTKTHLEWDTKHLVPPKGPGLEVKLDQEACKHSCTGQGECYIS